MRGSSVDGTLRFAFEEFPNHQNDDQDGSSPKHDRANDGTQCGEGCADPKSQADSSKCEESTSYQFEEIQHGLNPD